jgi:hypothetical protein
MVTTYNSSFPFPAIVLGEALRFTDIELIIKGNSSLAVRANAAKYFPYLLLIRTWRPADNKYG